MFFRNLMAVVAEWNSVEFGQADEQIAELSLEQAACVAIPRRPGRSPRIQTWIRSNIDGYRRPRPA
jgi:hypothetical protein